MTVDIGSNLISNPSIKTTTSGWVNSSGTVVKSSTGGRFQVAAGLNSAAYTKVTVKAGYKYAVTGVKYKKQNTTAALFSVGVYWYNSAGSNISSSNWTASAATQGVWNSMPRYEVTAPAGAVTARIYVRQVSSTYAFDYYATNFIFKRAVTPPTVNAGMDQSKVQGQTATLTATPTAGDGTIVTTEWYETRYSFRTGYTVTFPNPRTVGPFSSIGSYTYYVRTIDSFGVTAVDSVTVNVAAGPAPVVEAGQFQTIYAGASTSLSGSATSVAGIASWAWAASGSVTITSPTSQNTAVGPFNQPGTYTFTLTVTDVNGKAGTDTVVVTVLPVPASSAINDRARLEVLADDVHNLIDNHSGQDGVTTGWTPISGGPEDHLSATSGNLFGFDGAALKFSEDPVSSTYNGAYTSATVEPGKWVAASLTARTTYTTEDVLVFAYLEFRTSGGVYLGGSFTSTLAYLEPNESQVINLDPQLVPPTAANARIYFETYTHDYQPMTVPLDVYVWDTLLLQGTYEEDVTDVPFSHDGDYWQNVLGQSVSVGTNQGASLEGVTDSLEAGLLTAVVVGPNIAPDKNKRVRPGRPIRLRAFNNGTSEWEAVWTGSITEANATYRKKTPLITITATDAVADLSNIQVPSAVSGAFRQRVDAVLTDTSVMYQIIDTDSDTTSVVISVDDQGTAISQLEMARNSLHGIIYVDKTNTVQAYASNSLPSTTPAVLFSDDPEDVSAIQYADLDVNFGSKALINTLSVEKHDAVGANEQYTFGPYLNAESVSDWGTQSAILVINDGDPVTQAGYYLSTFANPSIFCKSVTFTSDDNLAQSIDLELYQAARVKFADADLDAVYRIIAIEHEVTPDGWETTVYFRPLEATGSVTVTVPAAGGLTGPADLTVYSQGIQSGSVSASFGGASTVSTAVTFPKPYASTPRVVTAGNSVNTSPRYIAQVASVTTTGFTLILLTADSATHTGTRSATWVAMPA